MAPVLDQNLSPIAEDYCIYSPFVTIFKDKDYTVMENEFVVSMIACAAFRRPFIDEDGNYVKGHEVAQLFNEVMDKFKGCFKYIGYGVKSFRDPNYDIFNAVINQINN